MGKRGRGGGKKGEKKKKTRRKGERGEITFMLKVELSTNSWIF